MCGSILFTCIEMKMGDISINHKMSDWEELQCCNGIDNAAYAH